MEAWYVHVVDRSLDAMFALYQRLKALIFERGTTSGSDGPPVKPVKDQQLVQEPQRRYFTGEVTSLSEKSGMIDQQVHT